MREVKEVFLVVFFVEQAFFRSFCLQGVHSQDMMGEYCMWETFNASCFSSDTVVLMTSARYGRMRFGRCVREDHGSIGCHSQVLDVLDQLCSGRRSCAISIPDAKLHYNHPCPQELMPYLEASYSCVKVPSPERCPSVSGKQERFIIKSSSSSSSLLTSPSSSPSSSGKKSGDATKDKHRLLLYSASQSGFLLSSQSEESGLGSPGCPVVFALERGQKVNLTLFNFPMTDCDWTVEVEEVIGSSESANQNLGNRVEGQVYLDDLDEDGLEPHKVKKENETKRIFGITNANNILRLSGCDVTQRGSHVFTSRGLGPVEVKFKSSRVNFLEGDESDDDGRSRGGRSVVMVKYKVFGCADLKVAPEVSVRRHENTAVVTCLGSGQNHVLTCVDGHWLGDQSVNCSKGGSYLEAGKLENKNSSVPIGLLFVIGAGVLIGVLMGILMLLMIVLFYRRSKARYMRSQTADPLMPQHFQHHHHHLLYQQQQQHLLHHHHSPHQREQSEASIYTITSQHHHHQRQCLLDSLHSPSLLDDEQYQQHQIKSFSDQTLATLVSPTISDTETPVAQTLPPCYTRLHLSQGEEPSQTLRKDVDRKAKAVKTCPIPSEAEYGPFSSTSCFCLQEAKKPNGVYIALEDASRHSGTGFSRPQPAEGVRSIQAPCASSMDSSRCSNNQVYDSKQWESSYLSKIDLLETNQPAKICSKDPQCCNQTNFF